MCVCVCVCVCVCTFAFSRRRQMYDAVCSMSVGAHHVSPAYVVRCLNVQAELWNVNSAKL